MLSGCLGVCPSDIFPLLAIVYVQASILLSLSGLRGPSFIPPRSCSIKKREGCLVLFYGAELSFYLHVLTKPGLSSSPS